MGDQARARRHRRINPTRLVPSRRGLVTVFTICGLLGWAAGLVVERILH
jgi:hypothetical protein